MGHAGRLIPGLSFLISLMIFPIARAQQANAKTGDAVSDGQATVASKPKSAGALLAKRAGKYTTRSKFYYYPDEVVTGTAEISPILDGSFIREETYTETFGKHYEIHFYGYDRLKNEYQAVSMEKTQPRIQMMTGTSSDGGVTVIYSGWMGFTCIGFASTFIKIHQVDDDHFTITYLAALDGRPESAFEETTYTRTN
jgi:hypothetical protein